MTHPKYYLFGRERAIRECSCLAAPALVEVDRTAELVRIARRYPNSRCSTDASLNAAHGRASARENRQALCRTRYRSAVPSLFQESQTVRRVVFSTALMIPTALALKRRTPRLRL